MLNFFSALLDSCALSQKKIAFRKGAGILGAALAATVPVVSANADTTIIPASTEETGLALSSHPVAQLPLTDATPGSRITSFYHQDRTLVAEATEGIGEREPGEDVTPPDQTYNPWEGTEIEAMIDYMNGGGCAALFVYGAGSPEIPIMRRLRDTILNKSIAGRFMIRVYYFVSPAVIFFARRSAIFALMVRLVLSAGSKLLSQRVPGSLR